MQHGGQLTAASRRYGIPLEDWLDISTGISPWIWPVPEVPQSVWSRLPEYDDGLLEAAADYYACDAGLLTPIPGSQFAIKQLPQAASLGSVLVPEVGYTEHAYCWRQAGHQLIWYRTLAELRELAPQAEHAVVINPDNPTARICSADWLLALRDDMKPGGLLVVDEAFMDIGDQSIVPHLPVSGVVALRSLGKFFGLAGLRLGFVAGDASEVTRIQQQVEPWGVSHPARWIGTRALTDIEWQQQQRQRIRENEQHLVATLEQHFPAEHITSSGLFATVQFDEAGSAAAIHDILASQGMLTRLGDNGRWLRFGLPPDQQERLQAALENAASVTRVVQ